MQLLIPAWESPYIGCLVATGRLAKNGASAGYFQERYISLNFLLNSSERVNPMLPGCLRYSNVTKNSELKIGMPENKQNDNCKADW